jgi:hypothetical protein
MKPTFKATASRLLKQEHEKTPSNVAFKFNLRRYTVHAREAAGARPALHPGARAAALPATREAAGARRASLPAAQPAARLGAPDIPVVAIAHQAIKNFCSVRPRP